MAERLLSADEIVRQTRTDIYLGVVAPSGVRREAFLAKLAQSFLRFGYEFKSWRVSDLLHGFKGVEIDRDNSGGAYLASAMKAGTHLRETIGPDCLARAVLLGINSSRSPDGQDPPRVHVIWSLKHEEEVATLRLVYGASFHLVGLYASKSERRTALLERMGMDEVSADAAIARDEDESGTKKGQKTRDTFQLADVFLSWGREPDVGALNRFVDLLFGCPWETPTIDEHRMFMAFGSASKSGEMGRQVGAVITTKLGDVLAIGSNDVPKGGGGLHGPEDGDRRDMISKKYDTNTVSRAELMAKVAGELGVEDVEAMAEKLGRSSLRHITEYGRAVHAEMDALLACGRTGCSSQGATIYVTTFPCHNCARHLIAAGFERVVFVEPYPKSRALEFHSPDLEEVTPGAVPREGVLQVEPFVGVAARRFLDYFSMSLGSGYLMKRKDDSGKLIEWPMMSVGPRTQAAHAGYVKLEEQFGGDVRAYMKP